MKPIDPKNPPAKAVFVKDNGKSFTSGEGWFLQDERRLVERVLDNPKRHPFRPMCIVRLKAWK